MLATLSATLNAQVSRLTELEREFNTIEYDIWTEQGRTAVEQSDFKKSLIKYYQRGPGTRIWRYGKLKCMVTNKWFSADLVIASHIWMTKTRGKGLSRFGLSVADLNNARNGLLMLKDIEDAFDKKQVCILYQPFGAVATRVFLIKILDPSIMGNTITGTLETFAMINMTQLSMPNNKFPYRRLLSFHARCSYKRARDMGWIEASEVVDEYFHLSETASNPDTYI